MPNTVYEMVTDGVKNLVHTVKEINKKYEKPHIKMSKPVKLALLCLRGYLVILVLLLFYKFYTILAAHK
jgi:hypothetical protein